MFKTSLHSLFILIAISASLSTGLKASADEVIEIPEEELAQESVLPKFDQPMSVKNRTVVTESKIEFGAYYGWNTLEPIMNQAKYGFNLGYHWSEDSAFILNYAQWQKGLNKQYTDGLNEGGLALDFNRAPELKYSIYGHYEWKTFYGKISLGKDTVTNIHIYPIFGAGMTAYEHKSYPGIDVGVGQKIYFTKNLALRTDLKFQYGKKPSPFLRNYMRDGQSVPEPGQFEEKTSLSTLIDLGLSFIF